MEKKWSISWKSSKQKRKQRKYRYNAPLHIKQKFVHALLSKQLRKELGTRSFGLRKGDEVKIMRGNLKGKTAKIARISVKKSKVWLEGVKRKKSTGEEVLIPFQPSNLMIISLTKEDKKRQKIKERKIKK
ncbi:MAG: 50S ribosomal protein L24 [Candidatus Aenigmatarchaeota archaeon]|nr:MAG: 50S ribosomal protein L24 [Candidatus Aenigmarchaeota archaeon]